MLRTIYTLFLSLLLCISAIRAQDKVHLSEKCGTFSEEENTTTLHQLGDHWGYGYNDLLADLNQWAQSPYVEIDSIGSSTQNRAIWSLKITSDTASTELKKTVHIHVRTHPNEVQGFWVAYELINYLLSAEPFAAFIREHCTFYIIPMYNPDGVELEYPRQNANHVDIESNWGSPVPEREVQVLKRRFEELMRSPEPIRIALNFHSAYACKRYFVYHTEVGTSPAYTQKEKLFIGEVKNYFPDGIQPWDYFVSWKNGTPDRYPESWWWKTYGEEVLALTYEDANCQEAGSYDRTAFAILHGITDYLGLINTLAFDLSDKSKLRLNVFPNPSSTAQRHLILTYTLVHPCSVNITLYDVKGHICLQLHFPPHTDRVQRHYLNLSNLSGGTYFLQLSTDEAQLTKQVIRLDGLD